ncbi:Na(+)-translocating NADH-quinone reductase subunit A [Acanthopleuribacter pedis]|uniref:Na(+)-translocating NADH-quinone reductase subunit A n=1 Tax=Acanthopleuribacter pedis TaxID=442870 RepID=A0A8J7Q534_9BACT|nr:Na(+)-translocating NADH-quinone reductase subunit A [Acanthopleuribacter pedis]MBO1319215.1 Na(+)-translocating NADH-quinone reductase subunit A [Acanthopleuribacter pedis]
MGDFKISKGYTVPAKGEAAEEITDAKHPPFVGVCPNDFRGLKPKLAVAVNDEVKVGSPLFFDKKNPELVFLSPAGGRVTAINYGPRRVIEEIIIATNDTYEHEIFEKHTPAQISKVTRETLIQKLLAGGVWPYLRRRPYNKIADYNVQPKGIFVNCMATAPLAPQPSYFLADNKADFEAGVEALKVLCDKVHVVTDGNDGKAELFRGVQGVQQHRFTGKHPAGLVGTHITHIDPLNKGETVWVIDAANLVMIGRFLTSGRYPIERTVALAGNGLTKTGYVRTQVGAKLADLTEGRLAGGENRFISGDMLSGNQRAAERPIGFYDTLATVLPEGREQHFLGWMNPGFSLPSFTRAFVSGFLPGKYNLNTNINGGRRAIVVSGNYDSVVALDIHAEFLVKATLANDIEQMEQLGILECDPEDFGLATYVCPSKTEVSRIIAEGLELMEKEG